MKQAMILFAHGARDARWAIPFQRLQVLVQEQLPQVAVHLAFLEFMHPNLPELVTQLLEQDILQITVVPVFLAQGGHVLRDLPQMLQSLQQEYPQLQLKQVGAIGEDEAVLRAIAQYCVHSM